jgi:hypothetical protein
MVPRPQQLLAEHGGSSGLHDEDLLESVLACRTNLAVYAQRR